MALAFKFLTPSPGTPGEGWGEGLLRNRDENPHPNPLPEYREREPEPLSDQRDCLSRRSGSRGGFTLIEVLATLLLLSIALPAVMGAISTASGAGFTSQRRDQAAALAESKLNELVATTAWNGGTMQGDFGSDLPGYTWTAEVNSQWGQPVGVNGTNNLQELDVHVSWKDGPRQQQLTVSTLVYQSANSSSTSTGGGS